METETDRALMAQKIWSGELEPDMDRVEDNVALVKRFFDEVWNRGNLSLVDEFITPDYTDYNRIPGTPRGLKGYKASVSMLRSAFPDILFTLDQIIAEGDRVAFRLTGRGTHQGAFMGIQPTGKKVSFDGMTFVRIVDGKITERWGISDIPGLLQQLGGPVQAPTSQAKSPYDHVSFVGPRESKSTTRVLGVTNLCKATKDDTRGIYSLFVSTVPPGEGVPIHTHLKEDEAYYLLEGEWELYDDTNKETLKLGPENYVYVPMGINHGFKNIGDKPGRLVLMITPGGLEGFFEGIGQVFDDPDNPPPAPSGPPDFVKAAQVAAKFNITFIPPQAEG
jgi:predicted ester cyclase/quercetin dioxygenase-like cupin family protein